MPVVSLTDRITATIEEYLREVVHDGFEVVYSNVVRDQLTVNDDGNVVLSRPVLFLHLYVTHVGDQTIPAFVVTGNIPLELILDGDMGPVRLLLEESWNRAAFGSMMTPIDREVETAAHGDEGS